MNCSITTSLFMVVMLSLSLDSVMGADEKQPAQRSAKSAEPRTVTAPEVDVRRATDTQSNLRAADGFSVEVAAAAPLVRHPMAACFDDRGRLFVAENAGVNQNADELQKNRPNRILLLVDRDGDGQFDTSIVFADKMTYPSGLAWVDGALYVTSAPYLWRLRDTDGDGVADERRQLFGRFNFIGIGNDLHGTILGPDGRLYWVHGRGGGGHEIRDADERLLSESRIAAIFSCWPDGTDLRKHCDGGMDNPVELAFFPEGQMIGSVNLLNMPVRNDALVHWMWGGVYPRHDVLSAIPDLKRTGEVLGGTVNFGHVALSGITRVRSDPQPDCWSLIVTEYNTHKVRRVEVRRSGSTYRGQIHDLLTSTDEGAYFTDVVEDADGSLLIINTGGWYSHCPELRNADRNAAGGIYRLRRTGSEPPDDPRGLKIDWARASDAQLLSLLADGRFVVRDRVVAELASRGDTAIAPLQRVLSRSPSVTVRRNAVWALCRMRTPAAQTVIRQALNDADAGVREAAVHAVFANRDTDAMETLMGLLKDDAMAVRREAATTIGVLNDPRAVPAVIEALAATPDRILEHALIYALIEIGDRQHTLAGLRHPAPDVRRGVLIALDQMDGGNLTRDQVAPLLDTDDSDLQRTALQVIASHKGWAEETIELLSGWLGEQELDEPRRQTLRGMLLAFCHDGKIQQLIADSLAQHETDVATRLLLLEVISRTDLKESPPAWREQLLAHLDSNDVRVVRQAVVTVSASGRREYDEKLRELSRDESKATELRAAAAAVVVQNGQPVSNDLFRLLVSQCHEDAEPIERLSAARAIAGSRLDRQQLLTLTGVLAGAGPLELPVLAGAFERIDDAQVGAKLIASLKTSPGRSSLSAARLKKLLQPFPQQVQQQAASLLEELSIDSGKQAARLTELRPALEGGDARRGREIFFSRRASCSACHRIGTEGGNVGPDLAAVGKIRSRRDLLESVVFPSATIVRGFEPVTIATDSGRVHTGIITRETVDSIYLRTTDRSEVRIVRDEVEELAPSQISVMPQGLDKTLTVDQLGDLLAFLSTLKSGPPQDTVRLSQRTDNVDREQEVSTTPRLAVVIGSDADDLERFAADELCGYLDKLFGIKTRPMTELPESAEAILLVGNPTTNPTVAKAVKENGWPEVSDQGVVLKRATLDSKQAFVIGGGSSVATMWAVYELVERWGVRYLVDRDVVPAMREWSGTPALDIVMEPNMRIRCWRLVNDLAHGPVSWSLAENQQFLHQIAKMKYNRIHVQVWPIQPFVHYTFRGIEKPPGVLFFGQKHPIDDDTIGREKFGEMKVFTNPELVGADSPEDALRRGIRLVRGILKEARNRGMETGLSIAPLEWPKEFMKVLPGSEPVQQLGGLTAGPGSKQSMDDPLLREMVATIVRAYIETYPDIDYLHIGTPEHRGWTGQSAEAYQRLASRYKLDDLGTYEELCATALARSSFPSGGARVEAMLKGDLAFLDFFDSLIHEKKLLRRPGDGSDIKLVYNGVVAELFPLVARMVPSGGEVLSFIDYTASRQLRQRDLLQRAPPKQTPASLIFTLADDNVGVLPQSATGSLHTLMGDLRKNDWSGFYTRYWTVSDQDPTVHYLARASWDASLTPKQAYADQVEHVCGPGAVKPALKAFAIIEKITLGLDQHGLGFGFPVPSMMTKHYSSGGLSDVIKQDQEFYRQALRHMEEAQRKCRPDGRPYIDCFVGRLRFAVRYLDAADAFGATATAEKSNKPEEARRHIDAAYIAIREALAAYVSTVKDHGDLGAVALMNEYCYRPIRDKRKELRP